MRFKPLLNWKLTALAVAVALSACGGGDDDDDNPLGINAVKGVEIGAGFDSVADKGSSHGDSLQPGGFVGDKAGGILGGISTGQDLEVSIAIKPTSSILTPRDSIDVEGKSTQVVTKGRHDQ